MTAQQLKVARSGESSYVCPLCWTEWRDGEGRYLLQLPASRGAGPLPLFHFIEVGCYSSRSPFPSGSPVCMPGSWQSSLSRLTPKQELRPSADGGAGLGLSWTGRCEVCLCQGGLTRGQVGELRVTHIPALGLPRFLLPLGSDPPPPLILESPLDCTPKAVPTPHFSTLPSTKSFSVINYSSAQALGLF